MGSLLQDRGPLKMQRQRTIDVLTQVMTAQMSLDRSRGKDEDKPYPDALIDLPPTTAEVADAAYLKRALAKEQKAWAQSTAPLKGKKPSKAAPSKDALKRVHFI